MSILTKMTLLTLATCIVLGQNYSFEDVADAIESMWSYADDSEYVTLRAKEIAPMVREYILAEVTL